MFKKDCRNILWRSTENQKILFTLSILKLSVPLKTWRNLYRKTKYLSRCTLHDFFFSRILFFFLKSSKGALNSIYVFPHGENRTTTGWKVKCKDNEKKILAKKGEKEKSEKLVVLVFKQKKKKRLYSWKAIQSSFWFFWNIILRLWRIRGMWRYFKERQRNHWKYIYNCGRSYGAREIWQDKLRKRWRKGNLTRGHKKNAGNSAWWDCFIQVFDIRSRKSTILSLQSWSVN